VVPETKTVTVWPLWTRPSAILCLTTMITPVLQARRWTRTGSAEGRGGGPEDTRFSAALPNSAGTGSYRGSGQSGQCSVIFATCT
jgi:hypothetical protein